MSNIIDKIQVSGVTYDLPSGGGGITSGEVQTMIDNSISGKVDISANEVPDYKSGSIELYGKRYFLSSSEHATYATGANSIKVGSWYSDVFYKDWDWTAIIDFEVIDENGNTETGRTYIEEGYNPNSTNLKPSGLDDYIVTDWVPSATNAGDLTYSTVDGWKISYINAYEDNGDGSIFGLNLYIDNGELIFSGGQSSYVIENVIEPELVRLDSEKQNVLSAGTGISISGNVISATGGGGGNPTVELTQAEYDALVSAGTVANDTYYIITDAQAGDLTQYWTSAQTQSAITEATSGKVDTSNVVSSVTSASTDSEIPTAKAVWEAASGGGGVNIVQTTGTSTTDVMSQDAVTTQLNDKPTKSQAVGSYSFGETSSIPFIKLNKVNTAQSLNEIYYPKINGKGILTNNSTWAKNNYLFSLVETSAINTSITSSSTDAQVPSAKAVNDKLGGLSIVKLTQQEYDALTTKDNNTLYVIT